MVLSGRREDCGARLSIAVSEVDGADLVEL